MDEIAPAKAGALALIYPDPGAGSTPTKPYFDNISMG
jgi:hypothetical protein